MFSDTFPDRFRTEKHNDYLDDDYLDEDIPDEDDTNATPASPIPSQPSHSSSSSPSTPANKSRAPPQQQHHTLRHPVQVQLQIRVAPLLRTLSLAGTCARRCAWLVEWA